MSLNCAQRTIAVSAMGMACLAAPAAEAQNSPDLVVGTPSVSDNSPAPGVVFTLSVTVRNDGGGSASATTLRYYRSTDATITASDFEEYNEAVGALDAGATSSGSIDLGAPSSAGQYYYGACVDAVTDESNTTNNCSGSVAITVEEPAPDLVVVGPSVGDSSLETSETFRLLVTVHNQGDVQSEATTVRYLRSTDETITTTDTEVGTDAVNPLSPSGGYGATTRLTAPSTAGTYYYGACVDAVAGESDTTNNCSSSVQVNVAEPPPPPPPPPDAPDLVVGPPSVSDSNPAAGAAFTLSAEVENVGDGDSAATTLRYYQSADATITASDTEVGTDAVAGLAASATSSQSVELTAPSVGTYYYGACVDAVAGESDTTNNCSTSVQVDVPQPMPAAEVQTVVDDAIATATNGEGLHSGGASVTVPLDSLFTFAPRAASAVTYKGHMFSASSSAPDVVSASTLMTEAGPALELAPGADAGTATVTVEARPEGQPGAPPSASVMFDVTVTRATPVPVLPFGGVLLLGILLACLGGLRFCNLSKPVLRA